MWVCKNLFGFFFFWFGVRPKRAKSKYFKMNKSTKRFVFFKEIFISFLHRCMFPASYFLQRKHVAHDHINGEPNETRFVSQMFFQVFTEFIKRSPPPPPPPPPPQTFLFLWVCLLVCLYANYSLIFDML